MGPGPGALSLLNTMIDELDAESPCIMMLGDAKGTLSDATLVVEAVVSEPRATAEAPAPSAEPLEASDCAIAGLLRSKRHELHWQSVCRVASAP